MTRARAAVAFAFVAALAACFEDADPDGRPMEPNGAAPDASDAPVDVPSLSPLAGTRWHLESYAAGGERFVPRVRETPYLLAFDASDDRLADFRMVLADACGELEGTYRIEGDALTTENVGSTEAVVSCSERPVGDPDADAFLSGFLANARLAFSIDGDVLTLSDASSASARFARRGAPATSGLEARLVGPRWMLSRYVTDAGVAVAVDPDERANYTVRFSVSIDNSGIVRRSLGGTNVCNGWGGNYVLTDSTLLLGDVNEDAEACEDASSAAATAFSRVLFDRRAPPMVSFDDGELVLSTGANESLRFTDGLLAGDGALDRLFDVRWRLSSFSAGPGEATVRAILSPPTEFELVSGTGIVNGTPGCIDRFGYTVDGASVTFVEISGTGEPCDTSLAEDETAYARQLEVVRSAFLDTVRVAFDAEALELRDARGTTLRFTAARPDQLSPSR